MNSLLALVVLLGMAVVVLGLALGQIHAVRQRMISTAVIYRLHFYDSVDTKAVEHLLAGLTGWRSPWWRPWASPVVLFEVHASSNGVEHLALVPHVWATSFERLVLAHLPSVHLERTDCPTITPKVAVSFRLSSSDRQLRIEPVAQSRTLLTALQPLAKGDTIVMQWCLVPAGPVAPPTSSSSTSPWWWPSSSRTVDASALRAKQSSPGLGAVLRIGAQARTEGQAQALVRRAEASLHLSNAPGVHFARMRVPSRVVLPRLVGRVAPVGAPPLPLSVAELVGPLGFPVGTSLAPGLAPSGCRPLRPSEALPETGTVIGDSDVSGQQRPIAVDVQGRYRHLLLTGPTGTGKTTLMINLVVQDLEADRAVLVLDPKTDLVNGILERMPSKRRRDVVVLDPSDATSPVGFNPLRAGGDAELAAEQTVSIMHKLWASSWGVRSEALLRLAIRTLILDREASLADIGPLLTSPAFRAPLVARLSDPVLAGQWAAFDALSAAEQGQWVSPPMNKLNGLLSRPGIRRVLAQPRPAFDLAHALDNRGVVLVPLSAGVLGTDAASLFGSFVVGAAWNYIQARATKTVRPPLMVHLDEVSRLAFAAPLDEILSQARSFNVGVTLATQHLNQLDTSLRHAVMANPRSRVAFQPSHDDAQVLARQFGLGLTADDLMALEAHHALGQLYAAGRTQPTCTMKTRPAPEPSADPVLLRQESAKRWGSDGVAVDAWLMQRLTGEGRSSARRTPPGRKPRSES